MRSLLVQVPLTLTLFPYTTLFRSANDVLLIVAVAPELTLNVLSVSDPLSNVALPDLKITSLNFTHRTPPYAFTDLLKNGAFRFNVPPVTESTSPVPL